MMKKVLPVCTGVLVVLAMVIGCSKKRLATYEANRGRVTGIVTLDGQPLRGGNISFVSAKDSMYRVKCMIKSDGTFTVGDAPVGEVLVSVETESQRLNNPNGYVLIPEKYSNVKTSGLTAAITKPEAEGEGPNLSFDLKSK